MALQIRRTISNGPPTGLAQGQLSVEMQEGRLWVGVPVGVDASGRKQINYVDHLRDGLISTVAPTNGQVLVWNDTLVPPRWEPRDLATQPSLAPEIFSLAPNTGPPAGGTSVVMTGNNFTGATSVMFGSNAAIFNVDNDSQITATSPAGSGAVDVKVTTPEGTSPAFSFAYGQIPTVTSLSPNIGAPAGGTSILLAGANFTGATQVRFGVTAATSFNVDSATQITATSPAGTGTANVTVTTPNGTSATGGGNLFTYRLPTVSSLNPNSGDTAGGTSVVITGTHFGVGVTAVAFGATAAASYTPNTATQITAVSPAQAAGPVNVRVTTSDGISVTGPGNVFTFIAPVPTVTGLSPTTGLEAGGDSVVLTGTNFTGATAVMFGPNSATASTIDSAIQITATSPAGTGTVNVTVTTPEGTSAPGAGNQFTYTSAAVSDSVALFQNMPVAGTNPGTGFPDGTLWFNPFYSSLMIYIAQGVDDWM